MSLRTRMLASVVIIGVASGVDPHDALAQPLWSIRTDDDGAPFSDATVATLSGSDVYVYDRATGSIVRIDRTGKVIKRLGAKGSGPGEFRAVQWMGVGVNDSLYVWDMTQRRLSIFSASGAFVRAELASHGESQPSVFGRLRDGRWLVVTRKEREFRQSGVDLVQHLLQVGVAKSVRDAPTPLIVSPAKTFVTINRGTMWEMREIPAMDMGYVAACEQGFLVGSGARRDVRAYTPDGKPLAAVRTMRAPAYLSGAQRTETIESWAGVRNDGGAPRTAPEAAALLAKAFDAVMPAKMIVSEQFVMGSDRSLWLAGNMSIPQWQMLGDDGPSKPTVPLPRDASLQAVSAEFMLVAAYGDNERLELWPRPAAFRGRNSRLPASLGMCTGALVQ